jgi:hypothetical protein
MVTAHPLPIDLPELDAAVEKLRRGELLTAHERALVVRRGEELIARDFEAPPPGVEPLETAAEDDEDLLEAMVLEDDDERHGRPSAEWREYFAQLGVLVPPPAE